MNYKYLYGPICSRRLRYSLGVDIIPLKTCSFDCVYCQLGRTKVKTLERKEYLKANEVLSELKVALSNLVNAEKLFFNAGKTCGFSSRLPAGQAGITADYPRKSTSKTIRENPRIDYITFSGSGEPTLNSNLGEIIREIKKITSIPVVVITNSSLLSSRKARDDLLSADLVLPSLDAATDDIFQKINRPHHAIRLERLIEGLRALRREFKGNIWLEVMLVKGINDNRTELEKLIQIIDSIGVDKVQLNTVVRSPAEKFALALNKEEMKNCRDLFGKNCEVIGEPVCKEPRTVFGVGGK